MRLPIVKMIFIIAYIASPVVANSLYIDYFSEYLSKEVDSLKDQRMKSFNKLKTEDELYTFYYLLGAEQEGRQILQKYLEFCINDHLKFRNQ